MKPRFLSSLHVIAFVLASAHQGAADDAVWNGTTDAAWAATPAFGLALADQDPSDDPDGDGMENLLEYALNGNPGSADLSILPDLDASGANFILTFTRREESAADTPKPCLPPPRPPLRRGKSPISIPIARLFSKTQTLL
jgi:hypothetical protein